jgi:hypothetical protein
MYTPPQEQWLGPRWDSDWHTPRGVRFEVGGDDPFGEEEDVGADWWAEPSEHDWNVLDQSVGEDIFDPELDPVNPRVRARRYGTARPWGADRRTGPGDRGADVSDFGRVNENKELARWTKLAGLNETVEDRSFSKAGEEIEKKGTEGVFTAKAKKAGMGVQEFAKHVLSNTDNFPIKTVRQASFAKGAATVARENDE